MTKDEKTMTPEDALAWRMAEAGLVQVRIPVDKLQAFLDENPGATPEEVRAFLQELGRTSGH